MTQDALTADEKISIIASHIKNIEFAKYNALLSLIEENASANPKPETLAAYNDIIAKSDAQVAALQAESDALTA